MPQPARTLLTRLYRLVLGRMRARERQVISLPREERPAPPRREEPKAFSGLQSLESRILFSASPLGDDGRVEEDARAGGAALIVGMDELTNGRNHDAATEVRREVVFVDAGVEGADALLDDLRNAASAGRNLDVYVLDDARDGVDQISEILAGYEGLDAVHIVSHGADGELQLGNRMLSNDTLASYETAISHWSDALSDEADLLLYGCDFASTADGQSVVDSLGALTGADIAASTDVTGQAALGADWELEYTTGVVETSSALSAEIQQGWAHTLAIAVDNTSTGASSGADITVSHTTTGNDRLMLVGVTMNLAGGGDAVDTVTYNGQSLSFVGVSATGDARVEIWALVAPDLGSHDVDVTFTANSDGATVGVTTFTGVDQTTPFGTYASNTGSGSTASLTVGSSIDELVFGVVAIDDPTDYNISTGGGQTELWDAFGSEISGGGTIEAGAPSVGLTWNWSGSDTWAAGGVSIHASTGTESTATATQTLAATQDAYIGLGSPSANHGGDGSLVVNRETTDLQRALLQFDFDSIPEGAEIQSATLRLEATSVGGELTIGVHEVLQGWNEGNVTWSHADSGVPWSTAGGAIAGAAIDSITTGTTGAHQWDITTLARQWAAGTTPNNGLVVLSSEGGGNRTVTYDSREGSVVPVLNITYTNVGNTAPTASDGSVGTIVDAPFTFSPAHFGFNDADGDRFDRIQITSLETAGTLTIGGADVVLFQEISATDIAAGNLVFTPGVGESGVNYADFEYRVHDGTEFSAAAYTMNIDVVTAFMVTTTADSGAGSLRQAILDANATSGVDVIRFSIGSGAQTISVPTDLPTITEAVVIDGTTQPGYAGTPLITLHGEGGTSRGLEITNGGTTIRGLALNHFRGDGIVISGGGGNTIQGNYIGLEVDGVTLHANDGTGISVVNSSSNLIGGPNPGDGNVISGNQLSGLTLWGPDADYNVIQGNRIGTNAAGTGPIANTDDGIRLGGGASGNVIGGRNAGERNIISGNGDDGIEILGFETAHNRIVGNYIGVDVTGANALGNFRHGLVLYDGAKDTTIGGTNPGAGNVISANGNTGVIIDGNGDATTSGNVLLGNHIGVNAVGDAPLGNAIGIDIFAGASGNTIGGKSLGAGNVISGNTTRGIEISGAGTDGNMLYGNRIGVDAAGTAAIANSGNGVDINTGATNTIVGGTTGGARNIISGNSGDGVTIWSAGTTSTVVSGNFIGTDLAGTGAIGNSGHGIVISGGATDTMIGGITAGAGNTIANSGDRGVQVHDNDTVRASIIGNSIHSNGQLGIDIKGDGVTGNDGTDTDVGPNLRQNFPTISLARTNGTDFASIAGTLTSTPSSTFRVELFASSSVDGSGHGEAERYLGFVEVTTDGSGNASFELLAPALVGAGEYITATATDAAGNTSEFAASVASSAYTSYLVTTTADSGAGSLRQAILDMNGSGEPGAISFNIAGAGPHTIQLLSTLPQLTESGIIDATTEPGYAGTPLIELDGSLAGAGVSGLEIAGGHTAIRGLAINQFTNYGIHVTGTGHNVIQNNFIGTDVTGTVDLGNGHSGIFLSGSDNNTIGGDGAGNVISGNTVYGIYAVAADNTTITGNFVGTNAAGTATIVNEDDGIYLASSANSTVGGQDPADRNVISTDFGHAGVDITGTSAGTVVQGNYFGTDVTGTTEIGNSSYGVRVSGINGAAGVTIGGTEPGAGNLIGGYSVAGVSLAGNNTDTVVQGNTIGTDATGTADWGGVYALTLGSGAHDTLIGGTEPGAGNVLANGTYAGINAFSSTGTGNSFHQNIMFGNARGIDFDYDGVTPNDADDIDSGVNDLQNFPVLTAAATDGDGRVRIDGTLDSVAGQTYRIEFFASAAGHPTGHGGAEIYLGYTEVTTDGSGDATFTTTLSATMPSGYHVTATATDPAGNTSEFAMNVESVSLATFQQSVNGYNGTEDTRVTEDQPTTGHGNDTTIRVDNASGTDDQGLIQFANLFGNGPGQIPPGATIVSASLTLDVTDGSSSTANISLHRMLTAWNEASTWNSASGGIVTDDVEALSAADATLPNPDTVGFNTFTGLESALQAWSNGAPNHGWAIMSDSSNGLEFTSSEAKNFTLRPSLTVQWTAPPIATDDAYTLDENTTLAPDWWDSDWTRRQVLTFDNSAQTQDLDEFTVLVVLNSGNVNYGQIQNEGQDLRFFDADGTALEYQIETWNEGGDSHVWVKVPRIDASSTTDSITMYYGNSSAVAGQDGSAAWADEYRAVYHLNEDPSTTGGVIDEATSNNFDGNNQGATITTGVVGNALSFDGTDDYVDLVGGSFVDGADAITLSAWLNADTTTGNEQLVSISIGGAPSALSRVGMERTGDEIKVYARSADGDAQQLVTTTALDLTPGSWHHVTGVVDYASDSILIYVDGVLQATTGTVNFSQGTADNTPSAVGALGAQDDGSTNFLAGDLDEVRIEAGARTAEWIQAQYQSMTNAAFVSFGGEEVAPTLEGVVGNDTDPAGESLTATLVSGPSNAASFTFNPDGTFEYTPTNGWSGVDTFTYKVNSGGGDSNVATVTLTINAVDNDPPTVVTNTGSTVAEGGTDTITSSELAFTDTEAPTSAITFTITSTPTNGHIALAGSPATPITSFTQTQLDANQVVYVHDHSNSTSDSFDFDVDDGAGNTTTGQTFNLTITAVDDDLPTQVVNSGSTIAEGGTDTIANTELAFTDTEAATTAITFTVTSTPTNGHLALAGSPATPITSFTQAQLDANQVVYVHNDSNTTSDSFDFDVDDGAGNTVTGQTFNLTITAVDDEVPTQVVNTGSTIAEGGTDTLANTELAFTDTEAATTAITFTVTSAPTNGHLALAGSPATPITSFTQAQLDANQIVYVHDGSNTTSDSFDFDVDDGAGNSVTGQTFNLTVTAVDDDAPTEVVNTGSTIAEGGTDTIANTELAFTDTEVATTAITFTVTSTPTNGHLALAGSPATPITSFTQAQLDANQVVYVHDDSNTTSDSFDFDVDDGAGNSVTGQTFSLTITAVDDDAPTQVVNTGSTIAEGGTDTLANTELAFTDTEAAATAITFTVTSAPTNGHLALAGSPATPITSFTQAQLDANQVVYVHDGSNTTSDSFGFDVDDGAGNSVTGQTFSLAITAVDDDAPTQVVNTGSTVAEGGTDTLANTELAFTDTEAATTAITFTVTSAPTNGHLALAGSPATPITSFTQAQLDANQVVYVHDGSNTTSDSFGFDVDDGAGNSVNGQTFSLAITAVDDDAPTQVVNTGSTLAEGGTDTLANTELAFTDTEAATTAITFTVTSAPANGHLALAGSPATPITSFTQAQVDANQVVYVHDGSNTTSDSFGFDVDDDAGNAVTGQTFNLTITAVDDDAPTQAVNSGSTIAEGGTDTLANTELAFTDTEAATTAITFTVTSAPANGHLALAGSPATPITSFTQAQLDANQVVYVHDGSNTTSDSFDFDVDDSAGNSATGQTFNLTVTPVDDDAPTQVVNTGSTLVEGGTDTLANTELAFTDTEAVTTAITFTVTSAPTNGHLALAGSPATPITSFTQAQLDANQVVYVHDGTNTTSDSFGFDVDDGAGNSVTGQTFNLTVTAVDDDAPTQVVNTGSTLPEGGTDTLANTELAFADTEAATSAITFTITSAPANGHLALAGSPATPITSFTQAQLDANQVVYVHDGSNTTSDSFGFDVDDSAGNSVTGQTFNLTVTAVDDDAPTQVVNTGSTLPEGGTDTLANTELAFTDTEAATSAITFTVTSAPTNGHLALAGSPATPITSFTQAQIDANQVVYVHDGSNTTSDSFGFDVDDSAGNSVTGQTFNLTVTAVDDDAPTQVVNTGSTIAEGGTDTLANTELAFTDTEAATTAITFTVTSAPANGHLALAGSPATPITSFTQAQIDANQVVYVHDGSNTTSDSFDFDVDDSAGNSVTGQTFNLTVTAVDDDVPTQVVNTGSTIAEGGADTLSNTELAFTDTEAATTAITFTVNSAPANGHLALAGSPATPITSFTQAQLDANQVVYVHDGSNTTSDSFGFDVDDGAGNTVTGQTFNLTITAVDDDAPTQVVNTGSTAFEGGADTLSSTELAFTDTEAAATAITFTVTTAPANGHLAFVGSLTTPITSFTQAQIDADQVVYVHDDSNTTSDSFVFDVDDGAGNSATGQTFNLTVTAIDDDLPTEVANTGSTVTEGGTDTISNTELAYTDTEAAATAVTFTITSAPVNGHLALAGSPATPITSFTQAQLDADQVVYVHDGSNTTSDGFDFDVDDGAGNTVTGQTFNLTITAVDDDLPTLANNTGSTLVEGATDTIANTELAFNDTEASTSEIVFTVTTGPAHGYLAHASAPTTPITSFTQATLNAGHIRYVHDGSNTTSDSFDFDVDDSAGNTVTGQTFTLTITAVDDDAPTEVVNAGSTLLEGGTDTLANSELAFTDTEAATSAITFTVTGAPTNGHLALAGSPATPITSFTQAQLDANQVVYVHDGSNTTSDSFDFDVDDSAGNSVTGQTFNLTITPVDDDAPTQVVNTGSTLAEGATDTLANTELAFTDTEAATTAITFTVSSAPANGHLALAGSPATPITSFTQAQLDANQVVYVHDGSNTTSDSFDFDVDDGAGNSVTGQTFNLTVTAVDDDAPTQVVNTGSTLAEGGTDTLANTELAFTDTEAATSAITFTVTSAPANGHLALAGSPATPITSFTQAQLDANQVVYVHDGSNTTSDSFDFDVDDSAGNSVTGQTFTLTITAVDDDAPTQVVNTGSTLLEGATDTLASTELAFTDTEAATTAITFTITSAPTHGHLALAGSPTTPITSFTQAQLDANQVVYMHDGSNTTSDSFDFDVDDSAGNAVTGQTFNFTVTAVDDDAPTQVVNTGSTLAEGGTDTLANTELAFTDTEAATSAITFTVTSAPTNGHLALAGSPATPITSFTQAQLDANQVVYVHDGTNTTSDSFDFDVDDSAGNSVTGQTFNLTVTAVDDDAPTQVVNTGSTLAEGATDTLANTELAFTDTEAATTAITFTVTSAPTNGHLALTGSPATPITRFTQAQIDANQVVYVHDGSNTASDSFGFDVDDSAGNSVTGQTFNLTVTAVDDDAPTQVVNTGSTLAEGATDTLANTELAFTDTEAATSAITFTVTSAPTNGHLALAGSPATPITSFTQAQLDANQVVYVHDGTNTTSDSFDFDVDDSAGNTVTGQTFTLTITAVDDNAPTEVVNAGSTLLEGGTDTLANTELAFTDTEAATSAITFTVTGAPTNGHLALAGSPATPITSFTQAQLDANQVVYVHDGSNTTSDSFDFDVDDSAGNSVTGQTFTLTITAVDDDAPTQVVNTGSTLAEGGTDTLANTELAFTDTEAATSAITFTVTSAPTNGHLALAGSPATPITSFTQAQLDANQVVYVHDGTNTTSDSFDFDVDDSAGNSVTGQTFNLTVTAVDDDAPTQVVNTGSTIAEGGTDTLANTELAFTDTEAATTAITFTVTSAPTNGHLALAGSPATPITSFTQAQIDANQVVYVHNGSNTTSDSFGFDVDDGAGNAVTGQAFNLTITAVDDDAPTQVVNTGSTLLEGATDTLASTELAFTDTEAATTAITFTITIAPTHGHLALAGSPTTPITSFTQAQLDANQVVYVHNGSNTTSDSFDFDVDDGAGNSVTGQTFNLTVTAVDDDAPTQVVNTGSTLAEGGTDTLANTELAFTDTEAATTAITFTVTSAPTNGHLALAGSPATPITSFTQAQLDANQVVYVHDGTNTTSDSFDFDVDDSAGNSVTGQTFNLTVTAVDDDAPIQVVNTGSTIAEGGTDTLANTELAFTDTEAATTAITFTVTSAPTNGHLALAGSPATPITSFTQAQIDANQVVYVHDGSNTTSDNFDFDVDDSAGNSVTGQTFNLTVTAVDDDAPTQVVNTGSTLLEGATDTLANTELAFTDTEAASTAITFTVTSAPANGHLALAGSPATPITSFTQAQLDANQVVYVHDGSNTTSDSFDFDVDDGAGNTVSGQTFNLTVTPVDDDAPTLSANTGSALVEGATDTITRFELSFLDEQPPASVVYTVTSPPTNGHLAFAGSPATPISVFTQAEIDAGDVVYVHDASETSTDSFTFDVYDGMGNGRVAETFAFTITPANDSPTTTGIADIAVSEDASPTVIDLFSAFADAEDAVTNLAYALQDVTDTELFNAVRIDGTTGKLTLDYAADQSGDADITVRVTDTDGASVQTTFSVFVTAVNDAPELVNNDGLSVADGSAALTSDLLRAVDIDNTAHEITFQIVESPAAGTLFLDGEALEAGDTFTQADLDANRVVYAGHGNGAESDTIALLITDPDGATIEATVQVSIAPVEEPTPGPEPEPAPEPEGEVDEPAEEETDEDPIDEAPNAEGPVPTRTAAPMAFAPPTAPEAPPAPSAIETPSIEVAAWSGSEIDDVNDDYLIDGTMNAAATPSPESNTKGPEFIETSLEHAQHLLREILRVTNSVQTDINMRDRMVNINFGTAAGATSAVAIGYAIWAIRGGSLLASVMSAIPVWQMLDPLAVLPENAPRNGAARPDNEEDEDERRLRELLD